MWSYLHTDRAPLEAYALGWYENNDKKMDARQALHVPYLRGLSYTDIHLAVFIGGQERS